MKARELRNLTSEELEAKERDLTEQLFRLRLQFSTGQAEAAKNIKRVKRDIARVKTVLNEKKRTASAA